MMRGLFFCALSLSIFSIRAQPGRRVFGNPNAIIFDVALHSTRKVIASSSVDTVSLWDYASGSPIRRWKAYKMLSVKFRDNRLAGVSVDGSLTVWNIDTGDQVVSKHISDNPLTCLAWLDSVSLVTGNDAGQLIKFNIVSGQADLIAKQKSAITALATTHKEKRIISGTADGWVSLWSQDGPQPISSVRAGKKWVRSIIVSDNDNVVLTAGDDGKVRRWKLTSGLGLEWTDWLGGWVLSIDYNSADPANTITTTGERDGTIKIRVRYGKYKAKIKSMVNGIVLLSSELPKLSAAVATHGEGLIVLESSAFILR